MALNCAASEPCLAHCTAIDEALNMLCGLSWIAGVAADIARHLMETDAPVRWARRTAAFTAAAAASHAVCDAQAALLVG